jgi:hypothetical protein
MRKRLLEALVAVGVEEAVRWFLPPLLPFIWLLILLGLTWEFIERPSIKDKAEILYGRLGVRQKIFSCMALCFLAIGLAGLYWLGIQRAFRYFGKRRQESVSEQNNKVQANVPPPAQQTQPPTPPLGENGVEKPTKKEEPKQKMQKPKPTPTNYDNIAEGIEFGVSVEGTKDLREQFQDIDPTLLHRYKGNGSVNAIDNLPPAYYDTAWRNTVGKVLICDPQNGISSGMTFTISEHPTLFLLITNNATNGMCSIHATLATPPMTGGPGFILNGPGYSPRHAYILDLPIWNNTFGIRVGMNSEELKELFQGYSPLWKSFAIDDPKESLQLQIHRKGALRWTPLDHLTDFLPPEITLNTELLYGGPLVVRKYKLVSNTPRYTSRGDDASQVFTWSFTWQRKYYGVERGSFSGSH